MLALEKEIVLAVSREMCWVDLMAEIMKLMKGYEYNIIWRSWSAQCSDTSQYQTHAFCWLN